MGAKALFAALLLAAAAPSSPVGHYRLQGVHDAASELILRANGRFDYALAYGALDEEATGRWRRVGSHLILTTLPKPVPPVFSPGKAAHTAEAPLALHVTWPNGRGIPGVDFRIEFESGDPLEDYINNDEGWSMPPEEHRKPVAVSFAEPIYRVGSPRFPVDTTKANDLTFILTPHDMGKIGFEEIPIDIAPGRLVMHRGGTELIYARDR
ncbi:MAG TPA: hypothetical protein VH331_15170 [Allosphingosinicella sp.]|jgi:hypothetical protein|nr:hypothetical protein [Allosphingosinicella sp.]